MNERIKKLLTQAGVNDNWNEADWYSLSPAMVEKFAELIVRECGNIAWQHTPETEELEYSHLIEDKILKHFGVEE
jgi:hypothetical protein